MSSFSILSGRGRFCVTTSMILKMFLVSEIEKSLNDRIHSYGAGSPMFLTSDKYRSSFKWISD